jgi:CBS domain-containing protein
MVTNVVTVGPERSSLAAGNGEIRRPCPTQASVVHVDVDGAPAASTRSLPVMSQEGQLEGMISREDVMRVALREATKE